MIASKGISLIEILISFFILSLMLLSLDVTQIHALREAKSAYYFSAAVQELHVIMKQLNGLKENNSQDVIAAWKIQIQHILPDAQGIVSDKYPDIHIAIFWGGASQQDCSFTQAGPKGCLQINNTKVLHLSN